MKVVRKYLIRLRKQSAFVEVKSLKLIRKNSKYLEGKKKEKKNATYMFCRSLSLVYIKSMKKWPWNI